MTYFDLVKKYGSGKGETAMWQSLGKVSEVIEGMRTTHPDKYWKLFKETYAAMCGPHFNEEFGMWQIEQMYFKDRNGNIHRAPNWTKEQYKQVYEAYKSKLGDYSCWDFAVTIEMQYTDYYCRLKSWFPSATEDDIKMKAVEMAIDYLNDIDDEEGGKIWKRYNG